MQKESELYCGQGQIKKRFKSTDLCADLINDFIFKCFTDYFIGSQLKYSWIFKSFCRAATATHKITIFKQCFHRWSGKHPPARWHQSFSYASDPPVFPQMFLENDLKIHVLLAAQALTVTSVVAVASLNDLKIQLSFLG